MKKNSEIDRRGFFSEGLVRAVDQVTSRLGIAENPSTPTHRRKILCSLEAVNRVGHPFGSHVHSFSCVENTPNQLFLVFGHSGAFEFPNGAMSADQAEKLMKYAGGISIVEILRQNGSWRVNMQSSVNRRICPGTESALYGSYPKNTGLGRDESIAESIAAPSKIAHTFATPWNTVLLFTDETGWLYELNPATGTLIARFAIGNIHPVGCEIVALAGKPVRLYLKGRDGQTWKFTTIAPFEARLQSFNHRILESGTLEKLHDGKWMTGDFTNFEGWLVAMRTPEKNPFSIPGSAFEPSEEQILSRLAPIHHANTLQLRIKDLVIETKSDGTRAAVYLLV